MKYIVGFVVLVLVMILAVVLLVSRGGDDPSTEPGVPTDTPLVEYIDRSGSEVAYAIAGPVVAQEEHHELRITVTPTSRTIQIFRGYDGTVVNGRTYSNSQNSYSEFLQALEQANFTATDEDTEESAAGVCPTGRRYSYELRAEGETVKDLWDVSCRRESGTFAGNSELVDRLFKAQIPDYRELTRGITGLSSGGLSL